MSITRFSDEVCLMNPKIPASGDKSLTATGSPWWEQVQSRKQREAMGQGDKQQLKPGGEHSSMAEATKGFAGASRRPRQSGPHELSRLIAQSSLLG